MKHTFAFLTFTAALSFSSCGQQGQKNNNYVPASTQANSGTQRQATFAAGCFWHEEALFEGIKGVTTAVSGYAGGTTSQPTYDDVSTGETGHAETVSVTYDSSVITYPQLLQVYFESQEDPTQVNGQGPDQGTEYRSIIFYRNPTEQKQAQQMITNLNQSGRYHAPIAAQVVAFTHFWPAEDYHQHYIDHNPDNPYVQHVSIPAIARYQAAHPEMVKPGHSFVH